MYEYYCEVTRIVDGDTLDVDIDLGFATKLTKQRIRMLGIDTPESRTRDLEENQEDCYLKIPFRIMPRWFDNTFA